MCQICEPKTFDSRYSCLTHMVGTGPIHEIMTSNNTGDPIPLTGLRYCTHEEDTTSWHFACYTGYYMYIAYRICHLVQCTHVPIFGA